MEEMSKDKMPRQEIDADTQMSEVKPTYPSRYKGDNVDSLTMKKIKETYESRYK